MHNDDAATRRRTMTQCLQCKSGNITAGTIRTFGHAMGKVMVFAPDNLKFLSKIVPGGPQIDEIVFACLDCGFIAARTDPAILRTYIQVNCES